MSVHLSGWLSGGRSGLTPPPSCDVPASLTQRRRRRPRLDLSGLGRVANRSPAEKAGRMHDCFQHTARRCGHIKCMRTSLSIIMRINTNVFGWSGLATLAARLPTRDGRVPTAIPSRGFGWREWRIQHGTHGLMECLLLFQVIRIIVLLTCFSD